MSQLVTIDTIQLQRELAALTARIEAADARITSLENKTLPQENVTIRDALVGRAFMNKGQSCTFSVPVRERIIVGPFVESVKLLERQGTFDRIKRFQCVGDDYSTVSFGSNFCLGDVFSCRVSHSDQLYKDVFAHLDNGEWTNVRDLFVKKTQAPVVPLKPVSVSPSLKGAAQKVWVNFGPIDVHLSRNDVLLSGQRLKLSRSGHYALRTLVKNARSLCPNRTLVEGGSTFVSETNARAHRVMTTLRKALKGSTVKIVNEPKRGYKIVSKLPIDSYSADLPEQKAKTSPKTKPQKLINELAALERFSCRCVEHMRGVPATAKHQVPRSLGILSFRFGGTHIHDVDFERRHVSLDTENNFNECFTHIKRLGQNGFILLYRWTEVSTTVTNDVTWRVTDIKSKKVHALIARLPKDKAVRLSSILK